MANYSEIIAPKGFVTRSVSFKMSLEDWNKLEIHIKENNINRSAFVGALVSKYLNEE